MKTKRFLTRLSLIALTATVAGVQSVQAAQVTSRSDVMGSASAGATTTHAISFTTATSGNVGSIGFVFCASAYGACVKPTGLTTTGATLTAQSGTGATGFSIVNTTDGAPYLTRGASTIGAGVPVSYTLGNVVNPSTPNQQFYLRITTYTGTDGATGAADAGVVAISTSADIVVSGTMPESLIFCTGTSGTTCGSMTGNAVGLGVFSPGATMTGSSVMSASTNASYGYAITMRGTTMQSGANTIPAMGTQTLNSTGNANSTTGVSQFGTNLRLNTSPSVGADVSGTGSGSAVGGYAMTNAFRFFSGDTVASVTGPSAQNLYTSSYLVNVSGDQAAGVYTSTLTYICTATF